MATKKKKAASPKVRQATEITVEVPHGSSPKKLNSLVEAALKVRAATDALDNRQLVVMRLETNGNGDGS